MVLKDEWRPDDNTRKSKHRLNGMRFGSFSFSIVILCCPAPPHETNPCPFASIHKTRRRRRCPSVSVRFDRLGPDVTAFAIILDKTLLTYYIMFYCEVAVNKNIFFLLSFFCVMKFITGAKSARVNKYTNISGKDNPIPPVGVRQSTVFGTVEGSMAWSTSWPVCCMAMRCVFEPVVSWIRCVQLVGAASTSSTLKTNLYAIYAK